MNDRHCPICGDLIPPTAHRLKKLCGKEDCMLEQQRISGRKSYNKIHGHTKPEPRECEVCHKDITNLRGTRIVCENPNCKEAIVKRSKQEYYARNNGQLEYEARRRIASANYRAKKRVVRHCQVCRDDISHLAPGAKICLKESCNEYREKLRAQKGGSGYNRPRTSKPVVNVKPPKSVRPVLNPSYQRKPTSKSLITIRRNAPVKNISLKEEVTVDTRATNLPEAYPTSTTMLTIRPEGSFNDPWNCGSCRDNQLSLIHI